MTHRIKNTLTGLLAIPLLALGISSIVTVSQPILASAGSVGSITEGANDAKANDQVTTLFGTGGIFQVITNVALFLIGAISVLMLIYGGIRYTISAGNSEAVTKAKDTIMYAIIGIVVAILAYAIVNFVLSSLLQS